MYWHFFGLRFRTVIIVRLINFVLKIECCKFVTKFGEAESSLGNTVVLKVKSTKATITEAGTCDISDTQSLLELNNASFLSGYQRKLLIS